MKILNELIEAVQDVNALADKEDLERTQFATGAPEPGDFAEAFKAGARSQARLGEALKEAIDQIDQWVQAMAHEAEVTGDEEMAASVARIAKNDSEKIRRILEKETSE